MVVNNQGLTIILFALIFHVLTVFCFLVPLQQLIKNRKLSDSVGGPMPILIIEFLFYFM